MGRVTKVLFYFPWKEVSGGPIYLANLASELAKDPNYDVFYTDYDPGLSDTLITNPKVKKVIVSETDFDISIKSPIVIVTPIYFANWLPPSAHPDSRIIFINWHVCSMDALRTNLQISTRNMNDFLETVQKTKSVFFLDQSHWLGQNTKNIEFDKTFVPISLPSKKAQAQQDIVKEGEINIGILGRLCADKIYSVTNILENIQKASPQLPVTVHIIGEGPEKDKIDPSAYAGVTVNFWGTLTGQELNHVLTTQIDILFGMGTSVLEGAVRKLPSVVIPHSMKPMTCDKYVYIQDSPSYCLGWLDTQFNELPLRPISMASILKDISDNNLKKKLGEKALQHLKLNHTPDTATALFKEALASTTLTCEYLRERLSGYQILAKVYTLKGVDVLTFTQQPNGRLKGKLFNTFGILSAQNRGEPGKWTLRILGIPLINLTRTTSRLKIRPFVPSLRSEIKRLLERLETVRPFSLILYRQNSLDNHLNQMQSRLVEVEDKLSILQKQHFDTLENKTHDIENQISSFQKQYLDSLENKDHDNETLATLLENRMQSRLVEVEDKHSTLQKQHFDTLENKTHDIENQISSFQKQYLDSLENKDHDNETLATLLENRMAQPEIAACNRRIQMDTCDKFLSEASFQKFCSVSYAEYQNLVRDLDDESVLVVGRILSRIQKYRSEDSSFFMFTEFEKNELSNIYDAHNSQILKLADDYYAYGKYILPVNIITTTVFYYEHFLKDGVRLDNIKNKNIIDAGGSFGDSALILSKYTSKNVHVFEPTTEMYKLAEKTIQLNDLKNITLIKKALGDQPTEATIHLNRDFSTISDSNPVGTSDKSELISIITLDEYVQENQIEVGLIKVDVEGFDVALLRGAEATIRSQKPTLLLSIYHSAEDFFGIKPLIESWDLGYQFKIKKPCDGSIIIDTTLIAQVV
jgi:FkbM family methyltransferase